ncbi:hypothetical protein N5C81_27255, partial [Rhizobium pusense]|nr:hypothetical protein [Agrobacterium pusense]
MDLQSRNLTVPRGTALFAKYKPGTQIPGPFRELGNTPEFTLTPEVETMPHYSSRVGFRTLDEEVPIESTLNGSVTTDDMKAENAAYFFMSEVTTVTVTASSNVEETFEEVKAGDLYQLGFSDTNPSGARKVTTVVITDGAATTPVTFTLDEDYILDADLGTVYIPAGSAAIGGSIELVGALEDSGIIQFVTREINYFGRDVKNFTRDIRTATKAVQGAFEDQSVSDRISELRQAISLEEKLREGGISTGSAGMTGVDNLAEMKAELNDLLGLQREIAKVERERNVETAAMSRESEAQKKAQTDINAAVEKGLDSMREEASAVTLTNRERFIEEKLLKARNDALEQAKKLNQEFLGLTKEQTEAIRQQAGALYDAQNRNFEAQYTAERGTPQGRQMEELIAATVKLAEQMGVSAKDLLTAMSYETGGTFDPWKAGPTTQNGQHRGLIQWGEPQAARYGVTAESTISQQIEAVGKYLADAGVKAGDGLLQIYAAINAGNAKNINASDAKNGGAPGTVLDKVNEQMDGHEARAQGLLAAYAGTVEHATKLAQFDKDRALDQQEYLTDYQKRVEQQKFELDLMSKSAREAAILKAVRDEENRARETGLQLTKEQRAETERLAAEEFDRSNVNREVNELLEQRSLLLERMDLAQSSGDQSLFASTATELDNVNTKLNEAIASAIAFWQAMGGEGAANAISQLQNMQITIGQSTDRMKTQFLPTAEDINDKLADIGSNAFSAFAQAIANGENAADAFFNALLQGISEFLIEIGKAIIKQALFNALTGGVSCAGRT